MFSNPVSNEYDRGDAQNIEHRCSQNNESGKLTCKSPLHREFNFDGWCLKEMWP